MATHSVPIPEQECTTHPLHALQTKIRLNFQIYITLFVFTAYVVVTALSFYSILFFFQEHND